MNSALQLLLNCEMFENIIIKYSDKYMNIKIVENLIKSYYDNITAVKPLEFKNMINKNLDLFNNYYQHDCFEFLVFFIDFLNSMCQNEFNDIFGLKFDLNIKCKVFNCMNEKIRYETNNFLILPIHNSLTESYQNFKKVFRFDDKIECEKCKKKTVSRQQTITSRWPNDLIIVLKRFENKKNKLKKNKKDVEIPLKWRHNYKLKGAIIHSGGISGGHYVYYGIKNNNWYLFNDSNVSKINKNEINKILRQSYYSLYKINIYK